MKIIVSKAVLMLAIASSQFSVAQGLKIVPPTPNATKMTEFHAQQPNLYTGTANVSIPLYAIDFDGWQLPITISYNATGIRTNEEASEVGLGWSLSATGVISRTVRGGDDFFKGYGIDSLNVDGQGKGFIYNSRPIRSDMGYNDSIPWVAPYPCPSDTSYYYYLVHSTPDTEPDIFNYNFFGYSGSFVLTQKVSDPNGIVRVVKLVKDATQIIFYEGNKTFTIVTPEGFRGDFVVKERSTTFSASPATTDRMLKAAENFIDLDYYKNVTGRFRTTTSWYLSRITSPNSEVLSFNYDLTANDSSLFISKNISFGETELGDPEPCIQTVHEHVYLKSIVGDEIRADFYMEPREDIRINNLFDQHSNRPTFPNSRPLQRYTSIRIQGLHAASSLDKAITFTQRYFNQEYHSLCESNENEYRFLRSRLDRLTIDDQEYQFAYYEGWGGIPDKFTLKVDHFGFYNGSIVSPPSPILIPPYATAPVQCDDITEYYTQQPYRLPDLNFGLGGALKTIKYPTKGYTELEYEAHTYIPSSAGKFLEVAGTKTAGGLRIKSIKEYDDLGNLASYKKYQYLKSNTTTGKLLTPLYNLYKHYFTDGECMYYFQSGANIPGINSSHGNIIAYTQVEEVVMGTGGSYKSTYTYENNSNHVQDFNVVADGQFSLNGQLIQRKSYDDQGRIVEVSQNSNYKHVMDSVMALAYRPLTTGFLCSFLYYHVPYYLKTVFNSPYTTVTTTAQTPSNIVEDSGGSIVSYGNSIQVRKDLAYSNAFFLESEKSVTSDGDTLLTEYKRPSDIPSGNASATITHMVNKNMISPVIEQVSKRNNVVVAASANQYVLQHGKINQAATYSYNRSLGSFSGTVTGSSFSSPYELKEQYILYDSITGKLLEFMTSDGITHSFVWGYNGTLPIVHGTGITYTALLQAHTDALGSSNYENTIRNHTNTSGRQVSTYVHDPLVGLTNVNNQNESKGSYAYDPFGRLAVVRDNANHVITQHKFSYKKRTTSRVLSLPTALNFGTFSQCEMPAPQTLTITNSGEDDLTVNFITAPSAFDVDWCYGTVAPGTSVDVKVYFVGGVGSHNGTITVNSNKTSGSNTVSVSADFQPSGQLREISPATELLTFEPTEPAYMNKGVIITNTGDDCFTITGLTNSNTQDWSASISYVTLAPDESTTLYVMRIESDLNDVEPANLTINALGVNSGNNVVQVDLATRIISLSPSGVTFPSFTTATTSQNITVNNAGNSDLTVTGFSASNSRFSISPTSFTVPAKVGSTNGQQVVTLTYTPNDFSSQTGTITINSDATENANSGAFNVSGQRAIDYQLNLSSSMVTVTPMNSPQVVTVANTGNVNVVVNSTTNSAPSTFGMTYSNGLGSVSFPHTLAPGAQFQVNIGYITNGSGTLTLYTDQGGPYTISLTGATQ